MSLNSLTITEALQKLRAKEVSSMELTKACVEQCEKVDGTLNAIVHKNFDRALEQAKKYDASPTGGLLGGIPYFAKDVYCEEGVQTTACSNMLREKNYIPPFDSTTTKRLKAAGAISLGKTNTDEFTMGGSTETSCYGVTRNPWDTTRVAGGSSGGSAAAVSSDECFFALGTDTGGSIRQPAGYCNITGFRPTYGRTSRFGVMSMASSLDTIGPMTKTVEDAALVLQAIAGKDPMDATTSDREVPDYLKELTGNVKGLRIGVPKEYFIDGMSEEVRKLTLESIEVLQSLGAEIKQISLPYSPYALATYYVLCPCEVSSNMARYDGIRYGHTTTDPKNLIDYYERSRSGGFGSEVKRRIMIGTYALSSGYYEAYYRQAQKVRTLICQDFDAAFKDVDVIATPVSPTPAFTVGAHSGDPVAMYLEDVFMDGAVMAGLPALSVPAGFTSEGLPVGLQMMGRQWEEGAILKAADAYEKATKWYEKKPKIA